jgi:hypothetical protein
MTGRRLPYYYYSNTQAVYVLLFLSCIYVSSLSLYNASRNPYSRCSASSVMPDELEKVASDFICHVCGAIFTTEQDRRQHLEKEMHYATSKKDAEIAKEQTELSEKHRQPYESP